MKMIITDMECENNRIYVIGNTRIGNLKGEWCCREKPVSGETYFFELNIAGVDRSKVSVIDGEQFCSGVSFSDNQVQFKGVCEGIDDVYVIRFSDDWIEMLSIENDDFSIKTGDAISFSVSCDCLGIYPYFI